MSDLNDTYCSSHDSAKPCRYCDAPEPAKLRYEGTTVSVDKATIVASTRRYFARFLTPVSQREFVALQQQVLTVAQCQTALSKAVESLQDAETNRLNKQIVELKAKLEAMATER